MLMSWIARLATKGVSRLATNTIQRATFAEIKAGTGAALKTGVKVAVKNPLKVGALGVLGYSAATHTNPLSNLWAAVRAPLDAVTDHGFSAVIQSVEAQFMEGVLVAGALKLGGFGNKVFCILVPAGVELFLHDHDFGEKQLDPFHIVWNVAPASAGGYVGCMVLGYLM